MLKRLKEEVGVSQERRGADECALRARVAISYTAQDSSLAALKVDGAAPRSLLETVR
jgi:hypothetical protein